MDSIFKFIFVELNNRRFISHPVNMIQRKEKYAFPVLDVKCRQHFTFRVPIEN